MLKRPARKSQPMSQESLDLRAEAEELHAFLSDARSPRIGTRPTAFKQWTPWDVVAHLHYFDRLPRCSRSPVRSPSSGRSARR